ncbi:MAG: nickel pincer cofactor biosynthesis protein LarC [Dehalococcoidia bacterium]|nr:nickel pincer cofactor biosynthesis protein LarC [Dehalococcoidia bacterium]
MLLGALLDAGAPLETIREALDTLGLSGLRIETAPDRRGPLSGTKATVVAPPPERQSHRSLSDIRAILSGGTLSQGSRDQALRIFGRLAAAEAAIHGMPVDEVHFHEVGAMDAIADVVGTLVALEVLAVTGVYASALPGGPGMVQSRHGALPLPAPATLALMAEANAPLAPPPVARDDLGELVTPTAAAILTTIAQFSQPAMTLTRIGYGIGTRDHPALPNVLRVWIGETEEVASGIGGPNGEVQLLETNVDNMSPELHGYLAERLLEAGALDAWFTPIQMKKGRPAVQLSVLGRPADAATLAGIILRESSTLGVRTQRMQRWEAERESVTFESSLGSATVKVKRLGGEVAGIAPEYEVCRRLAASHQLPLAEVYRRVEAEARARLAVP